MTGLIGKKIGMTSLFDETGDHTPCTVIEVDPCVITQIKTGDTDGYEAVQLGYGTRKEKRVSRALKGHLEAAGTSAKKDFLSSATLSWLKIRHSGLRSGLKKSSKPATSCTLPEPRKERVSRAS